MSFKLYIFYVLIIILNRFKYEYFIWFYLHGHDVHDGHLNYNAYKSIIYILLYIVNRFYHIHTVRLGSKFTIISKE